MATANKLEEILDAEGKSLFPGGLWRCKHKSTLFKIYKDEAGQEYWLHEGERDCHRSVQTDPPQGHFKLTHPGGRWF